MPAAVSPDNLLDLMVGITRHSESRGRDYDAQGNPITSPVGARFAMQTMPNTAGDPGFGVRPAQDSTPAEYNRVGRDYLGAMMQRYRDPAKAWAAYNWGPGHVDRAIGQYGDDWLSHAPGSVRSYVQTNKQMLGARANAGPATPSSATQQAANPGTKMPNPANPFAVQPSAAGVLAQNAGPLSANDYLKQWQDAYTQSEELNKQASDMRRRQFEQGAQFLQQQNFGPTQSEKLLALSSALLSPQRLPGFKGSMMNVMPVLSEFSTAARQANAMRAQQLMKLQQDYLTGDLADRRAALQGRVGMLRDYATVVRPRATDNVWSESLQRFVPRGERTAVGTGTIDGKKVVQYSDGTHELYNDDGTRSVYGPDGNKMADLDEQGNPVQ